MSYSKRELSIDVNNIAFSKSGSKYYSPVSKDVEIISQLDLTSIKGSSKGSELDFVSVSEKYDKSPDKAEESDDSDSLVAECELFIEIITEIFTKADIVDASIYGLFTDINSDRDTPFAVINIGNITNDKDMTCAIIEYDAAEKTIYIQQIVRCSDSEISSIDKRGEQGSGQHIMSKMKEVFFDFKSTLGKDVKMVIESDEANILFPISKKRDTKVISLSWMSLFSTGQTWYNKLGFREANYVLNTEAVAEFIAEPLSAVVSKKMIDDLRTYGLINDSESDSESVKTVFSKIMRRLKIISFEANNSKSGIVSDDDIIELNLYEDLLKHCIAKFNREAPRSFYLKFKDIPFVNDSGVGKRKRRGVKRVTKKVTKKVLKKVLKKKLKTNKNKKRYN